MNTIQPEFVEFIPQVLSPGVLYISERYRTVSHLCACGCGEKVVTPLSAARWQLERQGDQVSLRPSIGNWEYACRSHYWIRRNEIVWLGRFSDSRIAGVQERDRQDAAREVARRNRKKLPMVPSTQPAELDITSTTLIKRLADRVARFLGLTQNPKRG